MALFRLALGFALAISLTAAKSAARAQDVASGATFEPFVAPASNDAQRALPMIEVPKGLEVSVFAAEPHLANPVAMHADHKGRWFVVETFRINSAVLDVRDFMHWLDDDLASRTVADRVAMYRKYLPDDFQRFTVPQERLRRLQDTDGDGAVDASTVFADGFNDPAAGIAAGVLAHGKDVWFTCIPDVWRLTDNDDDGVADERRRLHTGYGVHMGFYGHDLHGPRMGPDGRIYFSIGDRGANVTDGGTAYTPDSGAVFRCEPDGSALEIFATGLRNPQDLAFDDYGNLFTGDNNSDSGDQARIVHLVEGGDSGWRIGFQFVESPISRGPWNAEKMWWPAHEGQPAGVLPPVANLTDGPSGLAYYPGTGLPDRYQGHFFLVDFRGAVSASGVHSFSLAPKGASFELVNAGKFVWGVLATDVEFGVDGGVYVLDWVEGWTLTGKGRIYRVTDPTVQGSQIVRQVRDILAADFESLSAVRLGELLAHADQRVRLEAQWELARRGPKSIPTLEKAAHTEQSLLARLHATWGLGQIGRRDSAAHAAIVALLNADQAEVRAQAARAAGDARATGARNHLVRMLVDEGPRVRFFAALALSKVGRPDDVADILAMLVDNANRDPYLRHAAVMALVGASDEPTLNAAAEHNSSAARLGVLLAWRRQRNPSVARFLSDRDPRLVAEAARAIYDEPIEAALPALAVLADRPGLSRDILVRAINASLRVGTEDCAVKLAHLAADGQTSLDMRQEALWALGVWDLPPGRDRLLGLWRPIAPRPPEPAQRALAPVVSSLFQSDDGIRQSAIELCAKYRLTEAAAALARLLEEQGTSASVRLAALGALAALQVPGIEAAVANALGDSESVVRAGALKFWSDIKPAESLDALAKALASGSQDEQQAACAILGSRSDQPSLELLISWFDRMLAGQVPAAIRLDLLLAARARRSPPLEEALANYQSQLSADDPLATWRESLAGGNAARGAKLFHAKAELSCLRCHKIGDSGGDVGPNLSKIGAEKSREYLLESIVTPDKEIAKGFDSAVVVTNEGLVRVGIVKAEDDSRLVLMTAEGNLLTLPKADIDERSRGKSAMPEKLLAHLSPWELRDLIEFLKQQVAVEVPAAN